MITIVKNVLIVFNNYDEIDEMLSRLSELGITIEEMKRLPMCG